MVNTTGKNLQLNPSSSTQHRSQRGKQPFLKYINLVPMANAALSKHAVDVHVPQVIHYYTQVTLSGCRQAPTAGVSTAACKGACSQPGHQRSAQLNDAQQPVTMLACRIQSPPSPCTCGIDVLEHATCIATMPSEILTVKDRVACTRCLDVAGIRQKWHYLSTSKLFPAKVTQLQAQPQLGTIRRQVPACARAALLEHRAVPGLVAARCRGLVDEAHQAPADSRTAKCVTCVLQQQLAYSRCGVKSGMRCDRARQGLMLVQLAAFPCAAVMRKCA
jgi:hypothetical protein